MDATSTGNGRLVQPNSWRETGSPFQPADGVETDTSILIHEVKSVPPVKTGLKRRLERAAKHVRESQEFARWLAQVDHDRAVKLAGCGGWILLRQFLDDGETKLRKGRFCQQPLICGFCAAGRASRQSQAAADRIAELVANDSKLKPYMVTLTMRSRDELVPMIRDFWTAASRMVERRRNHLKGRKTVSSIAKINAGLLSGEAKRGKAGRWHYHAHGIFLSNSIDRYKPVWEAIRDEWAGLVAQETASVQFQPIRGTVHESAREIIKYAAKWEPGRFADRWTAAQALHRVRRVRMFGDLHGLKLPDDIADDIDPNTARDFVDRLFTWGRGGYAERRRSRPRSHRRSERE